MIPHTEPRIEVGILFSDRICFRLDGHFLSEDGTLYPGGAYTLTRQNGKYQLQQPASTREIDLPLLLHPEHPRTQHFTLTDVVIGIHFHWERKEEQKFSGNLKFIDEGEHLTAVNLLPLEDYLLSVISSEMSATASPELLKAHAVISRSWLLAQQAKSREVHEHYSSEIRHDGEYIRWYDREDHAHFDVCADDHCQRYQGITKASTPTVREALQATRGEVLLYDGKICDARFSKCCGGISERFGNTWEPVDHPYLSPVYDGPASRPLPDLSQEANAARWILSAPEAFCHTDDRKILSEVLNDYDQETRHFFRWKVSYTTRELSALIRKKLDIDFGDILGLIPVERGASGRLIRLRIEGSKKSLTIGKELLIRKALSESHLYSSAFIVEKQDDRFILHGAGWGHGVGLCQIGAAVMGAQGYTYRQILSHYFPATQLQQLYK